MSNNPLPYGDQGDVKMLRSILVGRRIVEAIEDPGRINDPNGWSIISTPELVFVLDNGTKVYLQGNDGCGGCFSGNYWLADHVSSVNNIITNVSVDYKDSAEDWRGDDTYSIFVFTEHKKINAASFEGSYGNGYYGEGFQFVITGIDTTMEDTNDKD